MFGSLQSFNKGPAQSLNGTADRGLVPPPLTESQANIGQAGLRPQDLLLPGALGHDRLLEAFSFPHLSTVRSTTTKGAPNNEGVALSSPQTPTLVEQSRPEGVTHFVSFTVMMVMMPAAVRME